MFKFLHDSNGEQSSKRIFTLILMTLWVIYFFANLFYGKVLRETFEDQLFYLILVFYLGVLAEKAMPWLMKKKTPDGGAN